MSIVREVSLRPTAAAPAENPYYSCKLQSQPLRRTPTAAVSRHLWRTPAAAVSRHVFGRRAAPSASRGCTSPRTRAASTPPRRWVAVQQIWTALQQNGRNHLGLQSGQRWTFIQQNGPNHGQSMQQIWTFIPCDGPGPRSKYGLPSSRMALIASGLWRSQHGNLSIRIGLGWSLSQSFGTGALPTTWTILRQDGPNHLVSW